jgi:hypothetical protein
MRYALYCEPRSSEDEAAEPQDSFLDRLKASFRRAVREGEAEERGEHVDTPNRGRLRRFITRKLAEVVAEQRLLWRLRHETAATLIHPDRQPGDRAMSIARAEFDADRLRHTRKLVINAVLAAITGPLLFFVPGPNVVSWYFTFRAVGHFFSMRGASRALSGISWTTEPSPHLTVIADALLLDGPARASRIEEAAEALALERLAAFVERVADGPKGEGGAQPA